MPWNLLKSDLAITKQGNVRPGVRVFLKKLSHKRDRVAGTRLIAEADLAPVLEDRTVRPVDRIGRAREVRVVVKGERFITTKTLTVKASDAFTMPSKASMKALVRQHNRAALEWDYDWYAMEHIPPRSDLDNLNEFLREKAALYRASDMEEFLEQSSSVMPLFCKSAGRTKAKPLSSYFRHGRAAV